MVDLIAKRFETPDEVRHFEKGRFEVVHLGSMTLGRAIYEPGWKWSVHIGPATGQALCEVDHTGLVLQGRARVLMSDGREIELGRGDCFAIPPGHDSWVVGPEPYVSLHFMGADRYAVTEPALPRRDESGTRR